MSDDESDIESGFLDYLKRFLREGEPDERLGNGKF